MQKILVLTALVAQFVAAQSWAGPYACSASDAIPTSVASKVNDLCDLGKSISIVPILGIVHNGESITTRVWICCFWR